MSKAGGTVAVTGMKARKGFYNGTDESIAKEKVRYEAALMGAMETINRERARKSFTH